jgi:hypothetical protein
MKKKIIFWLFSFLVIGIHGFSQENKVPSITFQNRLSVGLSSIDPFIATKKPNTPKRTIQILSNTLDVRPPVYNLSYIYKRIFIEIGYGVENYSSGFPTSVTDDNPHPKGRIEYYYYCVSLTSLNIGFEIPIIKNRLSIIPFAGMMTINDLPVANYDVDYLVGNQTKINFGGLLTLNILKRRRINLYAGISNNQNLKFGLGYNFGISEKD